MSRVAAHLSLQRGCSSTAAAAPLQRGVCAQVRRILGELQQHGDVYDAVLLQLQGKRGTTSQFREATGGGRLGVGGSVRVFLKICVQLEMLLHSRAFGHVKDIGVLLAILLVAIAAP